MTSPARDATTTVIAMRWAARIRVRHWAHFLVLPLATFPGSWELPALLALLRGLAIAASILAFGYLLNGIADRALDRDPGKNPLVSEPAHPAHLRAVLVLAGCALVLALTGPPIVVLATLTSLGAGWAYSAGPRLKRLPFVGTLLNAACFTPLLFVGASADVSPPWWLAAAFTALLLENQLLHEGEDALEDRDGAIRTTYAVLGPTGTACAMALSGLGLAAVALALGGGAALALVLAGGFGVAFPLACAWSRGDEARLRRLRAAHRVAAALAGALVYLLARP